MSNSLVITAIIITVIICQNFLSSCFIFTFNPRFFAKFNFVVEVVLNLYIYIYIYSAMNVTIRLQVEPWDIEKFMMLPKITQRNKIFKKCFGEQGVKFRITKIISQSDFYS